MENSTQIAVLLKEIDLELIAALKQDLENFKTTQQSKPDEDQLLAA